MNKLPDKETIFNSSARKNLLVAERHIKRIIYSNMWRSMLLLVFVGLVFAGFGYLLTGNYFSQSEDKNVERLFSLLQFLVSVAALCVALATAVVTYFVAMLAYRLANQAKAISADTLKISKITLAMSQRETFRESAKHAAEARAALNRLGALAEKYLAVVNQSFWMMQLGERYFPLLQWRLQCLDKEVWGEHFEIPYQEKKQLLLKIIHAEMARIADEVYLDHVSHDLTQWQCLLHAVESDALQADLSLRTICLFWGAQNTLKHMVQCVQKALEASFPLWQAVQEDACLLTLFKADPSKAKAYSQLKDRHLNLHKLFNNEAAQDKQLEFILRANALAKIYILSFQHGETCISESIQYAPWLCLLSQRWEIEKRFYMRPIGIERVTPALGTFLASLQITEQHAAQVFHLEAPQDKQVDGSERFVLPQTGVDDAVGVLGRLQGSIAHTNEQHPAIFVRSGVVSEQQYAEEVEAGLERWRTVVHAAIGKPP